MTRSLERTYIALGSNLGDREAHLALGRHRLSTMKRTHFVAASSVEETEPIGPGSQGRYLNQMVLLLTALEPLELLQQCLAIEAEAGRERTERWAPRTLDLDIVRFGDRLITTTELTIPHPELVHRAFWQREIAELDTMAPAHV